jgi:ABC-type Fe3+/spermidine/putrescine transport system ATPase subunit
VYHRPAGRFVADFVGVTNLLEGVAAPDGAVLETIAGRVPLGERAVPGDRVTLAVRPEKIRLAALDDSMVVGTVEEARYLGGVTHWRVRLGDGVVWTVARDDAALEPGRRVGLAWAPADGVRLER